MQQKENIQELLKRYILNECSRDEIEKVVSYFKGSTTADDLPSVEEVLELLKRYQEKEDNSSDLPFKEIMEVAKSEEQATYSNKRLGVSWQKYASIAVIFMGIFAISYFFLQNQISTETIVIPSDAITLELEDGSIEILAENGSKKVVDKNGNVLGQQTGSQISYEEASSTEELVYNTLTVPYGKRFELKLSDGTTVHLNAGTSLKFPVKFLKDRNRKVYLSGEAFFDVSKDSTHPFVVNSDKLDVRVLGTKFNVSSYPEDDRTDVVLVEGSVGMHENREAFDTTTSTILEAGFKGSFEKSNGKIGIQAVVTDIYTSWIDGEFVFRNMTFENILRKMERHYDVSITNTNNDLAKEVFNASYGKISLQKVLEDLKLTYGIDYSIEGTNITIN